MWVRVENGRVTRGPQSDIVGSGNWLPYEERLAGDIHHATEEWGFPEFEIQDDRVIGTRRASGRPAPEPEQFARMAIEATQQKLDSFAQTRGYDDILSLCSYATSSDPQYKLEGEYGITARDSTWKRLYEILAQFKEDEPTNNQVDPQPRLPQAPRPRFFEDIESELPVLEWPV